MTAFCRLIEEYGTEDKCVEALAELRWPDGVKCPKCESDQIGRIETRRLFQCNTCDYQFSVRVGTVLQDSKLPLWKWFLAWHLVEQYAPSNAVLARVLGLSAKTTWFMRRKLAGWPESMTPHNPPLC